MLKLFKRKINAPGALFSGHYVDVKVFYAIEFDKVPCVSFICELDANKAFAYFNEEYGNQITQTFQHAYYDHKESKMLFNNTIFLLTEHRMVELADSYCQVFHRTDQYGWAHNLMKVLADFKQVAEPIKENRVIGFARQTLTT